MLRHLKLLFFNLFQNTLGILPPKIACLLNNARQTVKGRKIKFFYEKDKKLFKVEDHDLVMYFNEKMRGINTYSYGIKHRADSLADTYSLNLIKFSNNDVIIDCGANFGDIYSWTLLNNLSVRYISFEPSPEEFRCLQLNCKDQANNNLALSNLIGNFTYYIKSDTGASSLIETAGGYHKKIKIKTITLDEYVISKQIKKIKLFKLESEGSEPEILEGSKNIINKIEYIGVDGSGGKNQIAGTTIEYTTNFLLKNGFELISIKSNNSYIKGLFKNKNFS